MKTALKKFIPIRIQMLSVYGPTVRSVRAVCLVELVRLEGKTSFDIPLESTSEKVFINLNGTCQLPV